MRISRFIHVIKATELWDSINKKTIKTDESLVDFVLKNKTNYNIEVFPKKLLKLGVVVSEKEELVRIKELVKKTTDNQFQSLFLIVTTNCNLDCDYCFYRSSSSESLKKRENMTFIIAKKAIDKFYDIVSKNVITNNYWQQITFYGGEPLINKKLLLKAIPYVREVFQDKYTSIVINTNLFFLDDEIIKVFKDNNVEVQFSIDGNQEQHDLHRKTIDGRGSYDTVITNAKKLIKNGVNVLPMITATDSNVENLSDIIYQIVRKLKIDNYAVNCLITKSYNTNEKYTYTLAREVIKAYKKLKNQANDLAFVDLYDAIMANNKEVTKNSCGSTRKITVFPNGEVFACQAMEKVDINQMGNLDSDFSKNSNWKYWHQRNKFYNEECLNCEVLASCGGGCATGSYNGTRTIYGIDYNECNYTKNVYKILTMSKK